MISRSIRLAPIRRYLFVSSQHRRFISNVSNHEISPAMLDRARSLAREHTSLTTSLQTNYNNRTAKKAGELQSIATSLASWEAAQHSISELDALLNDKTSTDTELKALAAEELADSRNILQNAATALRASLVPRHPFASLPCLLELRPGAGGDEAAIFAGDLLKMYISRCKRLGFRTNVLKLDKTDGIGGSEQISEAILEIDSEGSYDLFRCEAGVHRVQRVPATENKGRVHTSAVSVLVLPNFPENAADSLGETDIDDPESDYFVDPKDVRTDVMRARGAGGQHVNTTDSAVRLTHIPTGTVVSMQESRSQFKNRAKAWQILRSRLAQARREKREEEMADLRLSIIGVARMGRGDKVRTYNWGQQRVTDHRSGVSVHNLDDVMEGGGQLDVIMQSVKEWFVERDLEALAADEQLRNGKKKDG